MVCKEARPRQDLPPPPPHIFSRKIFVPFFVKNGTKMTFFFCKRGGGGGYVSD